MVETELRDYFEGETLLEGQFAFDSTKTANKRPVVIVIHAWSGRGQFETAKIVQLAQMGYVGFALDVFGKGIRGANPVENAQLIQPFKDDRNLLIRRLMAAVKTVKNHKFADPNKIAAIGYCFGGMAVLDLARNDVAGLLGVGCFHGVYTPFPNAPTTPIHTKVLILHGYDDPLTPPQSIAELAAELSGRHCDWQLHAYGGAKHAFAIPGAKDLSRGVEYSLTADKRSQAALIHFLEEIFG